MEDKMIKDFDRAIEQMMNENAVTPPFGAWNRIAAELNTPAAAPVAARRALPVAAIGGFVAGALLIGGVVAGVLVYNGKTLDNITYPAATTDNTVATSTSGQFIAANVIEPQDNIATESNVASLAAEVVATQPKVNVNSNVEKKPGAATITEATANTPVLSNNNDVAVPDVKVANKANMVSMPYFFPPIDINNEDTAAETEADLEEADAKNETTSKIAAPVSDVKKRTSSSSSSTEFRGVKFKKKKRSKFTYGSIIRAKKH